VPVLLRVDYRRRLHVLVYVQIVFVLVFEQRRVDHFAHCSAAILDHIHDVELYLVDLSLRLL